MRKLNKKGGFTLAELLIVVAIIAVLVAIAMPVFTNQLERSRETTDIANIRSAYAEAMAAALEASDGESIKGSAKMQQTKLGWQYVTPEIAGGTGSGSTATSVPGVTSGQIVYVKVNVAEATVNISTTSGS